jgi:hypothetical protein
VSLSNVSAKLGALGLTVLYATVMPRLNAVAIVRAP